MCAYVYSWHAIIVDGHSVEELCKALSQPRHQPTAIIAKTIKGKGIPGNCLLFTSPHVPMYCYQSSSTFHPDCVNHRLSSVMLCLCGFSCRR